MGRLFGTDGVRGIANHTLTPELAFGLGQAAGFYFKKPNQERSKIIVGKDTRVSGDMLEAALAAGITSMGVDVIKVGIIPTLGVAYLCRHLNTVAGAMISASHNPVEDDRPADYFSDGTPAGLGDPWPEKPNCQMVS